MHEKYAARPDSLEHVCLAQFAMWYEDMRQGAKMPKNSETLSEQQIFCPHLKEPVFMPKYIQLKDPKLRSMYMRQSRKVLKIHKFKETEDAHQFFYSELVLYMHWRNEDELHADNFDDA